MSESKVSHREVGFRAEGEGRLQEVWIWGKRKGCAGDLKIQRKEKEEYMGCGPQGSWKGRRECAGAEVPGRGRKECMRCGCQSG